MDILEQLQQALVDLDDDKVTSLLQRCIDQYQVNEIIENGLAPGIRRVGDLFEEGEYFLPELMLGAEIMKESMETLQPLLVASEKSSKQTVIVIGTVKGDIHDIGKTLVGSLLTASGYNVHDLGNDTPTELFIEKIKETNAQFLCLSALLTTTMSVQKEIIEQVKVEGLDVRILVGGAPVNHKWAEAIGADGYASSAVEAVKLIDKMVN
ncbi:MAG: corrinoid protein [Candidatus Heimdallarchaeota archaeon]|nr:corrinoid protein [Candidatus Heimdallarchaeota archaeon]